MGEEQDKQDKPEKKLEPPPKVIDPELAERVDFAEKPRKKTTITFKREDLCQKNQVNNHQNNQNHKNRPSQK